MQQEDPNYGRPREPGSPVGGPIGGTGVPTGRADGPMGMSVQDERTWSMLAHLSVLANIVVWAITLGTVGIPLLGPVAALVIWLVYKDRSQRVAFHALQSLWYQIAWLLIIGAGWIITIVLSLVLVGLLLVPVMIFLPLVPLVHQCYAAYKVYQGVDYRYPIIAGMIDGGRRVA